ncbi:hypothetical protein RRF57_010527 [Xylaria bambusicola]|uniref:Methyltransferase domain-containing protein n=1 Tax=Xylaria bambusicola TaxID=326684 RepID=A0AAN7V1I9_9PEZI
MDFCKIERKMSRPQKTPKEIATAAEQNAHLYSTQIPPQLEPMIRLLRTSGIAPPDVEAHLHAILIEQRDKAWAIFPYGAIGSFSFLDMNPSLDDPLFQAVIKRLNTPGSTETFLDVGCGLGFVLRYLAAEGVSSERLYGTDLQERFLDLGYDLFHDRDRTKATYVSGDMLGEEDSSFRKLRGQIDIIYASAFFHLFEAKDQMKAAKRMVGFLKPDCENALIFGQNGGPKIPSWEKYVLDKNAWSRMWDEVGKATGTSWRTETNVESSKEWIRVRFAIYRVV